MDPVMVDMKTYFRPSCTLSANHQAGHRERLLQQRIVAENAQTCRQTDDGSLGNRAQPKRLPQKGRQKRSHGEKEPHRQAMIESSCKLLSCAARLAGTEKMETISRPLKTFFTAEVCLLVPS